MKVFKKVGMPKEYTMSINCVANPYSNGGESFAVEVDFFDNGDDQNSIFTNIHLKLQSYSNECQMTLTDVGLEQLASTLVELSSYQKTLIHLKNEKLKL